MSQELSPLYVDLAIAYGNQSGIQDGARAMEEPTWSMIEESAITTQKKRI